jgi:hypothetical protein
MSAKLPESKLPVERPVGRAEGGLQPEDFYMDGPCVVFTAAYHLKRGYCCESGCRHCPYGSD